MTREHPNKPFARYADDAIVHCKTEKEAQSFMDSLETRLKNVKLELNREKSSIVYCQDSNRKEKQPKVKFTFLGFDFKPRSAVNRRGNKFTSFLPGASLKAKGRMMSAIGSWRLGRLTSCSIAELSKKFNPILRGWMNYYGKFDISALSHVFQHFDRALTRCLRRKFKNLWKHKTLSYELLSQIRKNNPSLFVHWQRIQLKAQDFNCAVRPNFTNLLMTKREHLATHYFVNLTFTEFYYL
ncbi:MAG: hypothetical protein HRU19_32415 [Pseudobacteriovorax sp.]|nr:hypothetical protein [Pseudobacteriovorax sp.]